MRTWFWISCILLRVLFVSLAADSQQWSVNWQEEKHNVWLGLPFTLTLVSVNGPNDMDLNIESNRDWKIESQKVQAVKGKTPTIVYHLNCLALKAGSLPLPSLQLNSQQSLLEVPELKIDVKSPEVHEESRLELSFSKDEVYEREAVLLKAKWTTTLPLDAIKALKWVIPALEHPELRVVEKRQFSDLDESKSIGLPIGQRRIIGTWKIDFLDGKEANTLYFEILVQAKQAGELELNPSFLVCSVEKNLEKYENKKWRGNRYPSYFNNNFFEGSQTVDNMRRTIVMSKAQRLKVKPLPPKPNSAQAEVTVFFAKITLSAEPKQLKVGDPLQVEIKVEHAMPEIFELPALSSMPAFERNFKTPEDRSPASYNKKGEKIYVQTLRPKRSDLNMVPPIVLTCFDPETGFYREIESNTVAIEVSGRESSAMEMAEFAGNLVIKSSVDEDPEGIWHHVWDVRVHPEFKNNSPWLWRVIAFLVLFVMITIQFGPYAIQQLAVWRYDSYGQKAKRFKSDLYDWRAQSNDRKRLRSIVLEHLSEHLKQPRTRYDEDVLLGELKKSGIDQHCFTELVEWLSEQEKAFGQSSVKIAEGNIKTVLLQIFRRKVA